MCSQSSSFSFSLRPFIGGGSESENENDEKGEEFLCSGSVAGTMLTKTRCRLQCSVDAGDGGGDEPRTRSFRRIYRVFCENNTVLNRRKSVLMAEEQGNRKDEEV